MMSSASKPQVDTTIDSEHWLRTAQARPTGHCDCRTDPADISLIVIHCVSLPEGQFGTGAPERLFLGQLDCTEHESFADLSDLHVAPHLFIDRAGAVTQFVPFNQRAWHAGVSAWGRRSGCNDFSIGIELEGDVASRFTRSQYDALHTVLINLCEHYPQLGVDRIVGHQDVAPGRKFDPGPFFDWHGLLTGLNAELSQLPNPVKG